MNKNASNSNSACTVHCTRTSSLTKGPGSKQETQRIQQNIYSTMNQTWRAALCQTTQSANPICSARDAHPTTKKNDTPCLIIHRPQVCVRCSLISSFAFTSLRELFACTSAAERNKNDGYGQWMMVNLDVWVSAPVESMTNGPSCASLAALSTCPRSMTEWRMANSTRHRNSSCLLSSPPSFLRIEKSMAWHRCDKRVQWVHARSCTHLLGLFLAKKHTSKRNTEALQTADSLLQS